MLEGRTVTPCTGGSGQQCAARVHARGAGGLLCLPHQALFGGRLGGRLPGRAGLGAGPFAGVVRAGGGRSLGAHHPSTPRAGLSPAISHQRLGRGGGGSSRRPGAAAAAAVVLEANFAIGSGSESRQQGQEQGTKVTPGVTQRKKDAKGQDRAVGVRRILEMFSDGHPGMRPSSTRAACVPHLGPGSRFNRGLLLNQTTGLASRTRQRTVILL
ncbi:hypothetical protein PLESTB_000776400 [Pleodorina starrii]|uniref:Uncharacterized protein n=1 Tax=Pleodorina starrii TaxID=330485 RepID=A0A9W6BK63_9CHLO|nr:hypothetical protein PLESTM_000508100 [Pleodorina starrii]GLC53687.1 hypothetical protein PLESTB_000776400 [Pleodorina starrii]GLC72870.1 hypothetical protein PLESTF_001304300 [Pleodorina starrii]